MDRGDTYSGDKHRPFVPIGADPDELRELADAIVRGASIKNAEIADLRALIEAVQSHPDARLASIGDDGKPTIEDPTKIAIHGGEVLYCDCTNLDIGVTLSAPTRFAGVADFRSARFAGDADFDGASFAGDANFFDASFAGDANFFGASFAGGAYFFDASFAGGAYFFDASFAGDAYFFSASFAGDAYFRSASFAGNTYLDGRSLDLRYVDFAERARRAIDERKTKQDESKKSSRWRRLWSGLSKPARWMYASSGRFVKRTFGWPIVRGAGDLRILTRVSILALVLVPVLAGVWPALRVAVNRYNSAVTEAAERFDDAAQRLEAAGEDAGETQAIGEVINELRDHSLGWRDRFGAMTADEPCMPDSLALVFFAAVCITLGQILYQIFAPERIRRLDEDGFVEWMHNRYPESAPDRDDGLRRATDMLAAMARRRPDRHVNFVEHHGETVWIPPTSRIDWFEDTEEETADADGEVESKSHPAPKQTEGVIPGAERARIALEEGARAEYWLTGREKPAAAWVSFAFYVAAVILLLWILWIQAIRIAEAAGWWG